MISRTNNISIHTDRHCLFSCYPSFHCEAFNFYSYLNWNIGSFHFFIFMSTILLGSEQIVEDKHELFWLAIKHARMDCGLTQEALAELARISVRWIIFRLWPGSFFSLLMEPDNTVLFPRALDNTFALSEFGANPPNRISWQLSMMISLPSFP